MEQNATATKWNRMQQQLEQNATASKWNRMQQQLNGANYSCRHDYLEFIVNFVGFHLFTEMLEILPKLKECMFSFDKGFIY